MLHYGLSFYKKEAVSERDSHYKEISRTINNPSLSNHDRGCYYHAAAREIEHMQGEGHRNYTLYQHKAYECFLKAIKESKTAGAYVEFANFLYRDQRYEPALNYLRKALILQDSRLSYSHLERLNVTKEMRGEIDFHGSVKLNASIFGHYLHVILHKQIGQLDTAQECLKQFHNAITQANTTDFINYSLLGYASMQLGQYQEAKEAFTQAIQLHKPTDTKPSYILAEANLRQCLSKMQTEDLTLLSSHRPRSYTAPIGCPFSWKNLVQQENNLATFEKS
jgi:tetratricopeptide (TPR) repeat protein